MVSVNPRPVAINMPGGKRLVTTLVRPKGESRSVPAHSVIVLVGKSGRRILWKPGTQYTGGAMWHSDVRGNLFGYDFRHPGQVYICRLNGEHVAKLYLSLLRKNILKPVFFRTSSRGIRYIAANGLRKTLTWSAVERNLRRRRGTPYARNAMRWLTGGQSR